MWFRLNSLSLIGVCRVKTPSEFDFVPCPEGRETTFTSDIFSPSSFNIVPLIGLVLPLNKK